MIVQEDVIQKHVNISMKNKEMINGFVIEVNEGFMKVIDYDNSLIYVNTDSISYIKMPTSGNTGIKKVHVETRQKDKVSLNNSRPDLAAVISKSRQHEFSMPMSEQNDNAPCGSIPSFERQTKRGEGV